MLVGAAGADPVPEHDSHGKFIYLIAEYYRHTHDRALVESHWPRIERTVAYIDSLRHQRLTKRYEGTPEYGLVPQVDQLRRLLGENNAFVLGRLLHPPRTEGRDVSGSGVRAHDELRVDPR